MGADGKRIAKNTAWMYLRLLVTIPLAFYTSRVVLRRLGVDDFGIYQAVAGIISMFAILRGAFDSATQRYYNVAMAKKDDKLLSMMFTASVIIQLVIAVFLIIGIEFFGQWFIANKMQYPHASLRDVYFVFHTMVISVFFMVVKIPFAGMIIAKEHMKFYAYLSIIDVLLKLGLVFLLIFVDANKLKIYAIFQMSVPMVLFGLSVVYFFINFREVRLTKTNMALVKNMSVFSGWGLMGNICYSLVNEGVNLLLNVFGGVVANAARGIAYQVRGVISNVLSTTIMPVRPQATQLYVNDEKKEFWGIIYTYSRIIFFLASVMVIPICVFSCEILQLWLGITPKYSEVFLQILMIYTLIRSFHEPLDIVFKASGRMKAYQITTVSISSFVFFFSWLALEFGAPVYIPFVIFCMIEWILLCALAFLARKEGLDVVTYFKTVLLPCFGYSLLGVVLCQMFKLLSCYWLIPAIMSVVMLFVMGFLIILNKTEKNLVKSKILGKYMPYKR